MSKLSPSRVFAVILTITIMGAATIQPVNSETAESWATKESMITARASFGAAVAFDKIYVIGGSGTDVNEEYNPATNQWTTKKPMPTLRYGFAVAVFQNKIYVMGGETPDRQASAVNEVYDPLTDSWETKAEMPTARRDFEANIVGGKIYAVGGMVSEGYISTILDVNEVYNPATDTWTTAASLPVPIYGAASEVLNDSIYFFGGETFSGGVLNQIYDPEKNSWSSGKNMSTPIYGMSATATTGVSAPQRIYLMGGFVAGSLGDAFSINQIYDPEADEWNLGAPMPAPRVFLGVVSLSDVLYVLGGSPGYGEMQFLPPTSTNWQYVPANYKDSSQQQPETFPTELVIIVVIAIAGGVIAGVYLKNKKRGTGS